MKHWNEFVKEGATVWWDDPDDGVCSGYKTVTAISRDGDGCIRWDTLVELDHGTEVQALELSEHR